MTEFICLKTFDNEPEAELCKGLLEQAGIDVILSKDDCGGMRPALNVTTGIRLLVNSDEVNKANELIGL